LYYGGFLIVGLCTLLVIAAAAHPRSVVAKYLGIRPLRYIGTRSYGLYLWHWPIFVLTRPLIDVPWSPGTTLAVRVLLTFGLTELSYQLIERPFRQGLVRRWLTGLRNAPPHERQRRYRATAWAVGASLLILLPLVIAVGTAKPKASAVVASLKAGQAAVSSQGTLVPDGSPRTTVAATSVPSSSPTSTPDSISVSTVPTTTIPPTTTTAPPPQPIASIAIGDSVMLGAAPQLKDTLGTDSYIDAKVGRQFKEAVTLAQWLRDQGKLGNVVIVHLGNNGTVSDDTIEDLLNTLKAVPRVILVNVRVTKPWQDSVNAALAAHAATHPNVTFVDWLTASAPHPDYFYSDGTHLRPEGAVFYAATIKQAIGG
jgi:hypothetical protein